MAEDGAIVGCAVGLCDAVGAAEAPVTHDSFSVCDRKNKDTPKMTRATPKTRWNITNTPEKARCAAFFKLMRVRRQQRLLALKLHEACSAAAGFPSSRAGVENPEKNSDDFFNRHLITLATTVQSVTG